MMRSDVSSPPRCIGKTEKTGRAIGIGLIAVALIVSGLLLALAWVMLEASPILANEYTSFV